MASRKQETASDSAPFVQKIVSDAQVPADVHVLTGWPGESTRKEFQRIYLTIELNEYVEVPAAAIRHTEPVGGQAGGLQRTIFWLEQGTRVSHTRTSSIEVQALFLQGSILRSVLTRLRSLEIAAWARGRAAGDPQTAGNGCPPVTEGNGCPPDITKGGPECVKTGPFDPGCCAVTEFPLMRGFAD